MPSIRKVSRLKEVPGIGVDRAGNLADQLKDPAILRLENMDTDVPPLRDALIATQEAILRDDNNSYLPFFGQNELRRVVAEHVSRVSGVHYDPQSQCIISAGGLVGILNCLLALLEVGDEVIVTDPVYAGLINRVRIAGGVTKFVPLIPSPEGWRLDLDALASSVTERTRVLLLPNPSMPTGHVLNETEWQAIVKLCVEKDLWLLYDSALERVLFDGRKVVHPASFPGMAERTITVGTASKELRMIGWRVGWVVGPRSIMNDIGLVSLSNVVCQVGIAMPGVATALKAGNADVAQAVAIWEGRRNLLLQELKGLPVIPPHGGWSLLLDTQTLGMSPDKAASLLLEKAKIAATPMINWGPKAANYLRFVYANEPEERLRGVGKKVKEALGQ